MRFTLDWLALRESADHAARSILLTQIVADALRADPADPVQVLDLGAGTGSNARFLLDRLPPHQEWLLVDLEPTLIAQIPTEMRLWAAARAYDASTDGDGLCLRGAGLSYRLSTRSLDLRLLDDAEVFSGRALVTASALLDLVSERWLALLAARSHENGSSVLFALTYDGRIECSPGEPEDDRVRELVNRHQRIDKGFGPALGPDAAKVAARCFAEHGYQVRVERSDWVLGQESRDLQRQLIDGWAEAAVATVPAEAQKIAGWRARRLAHVERSRSRLVVGHEDLAAWLPANGTP